VFAGFMPLPYLLIQGQAVKGDYLFIKRIVVRAKQANYVTGTFQPGQNESYSSSHLIRRMVNTPVPLDDCKQGGREEQAARSDAQTN